MSRLFGIYEKALPPSLPFGGKLALARRAGYDFIEICIDESDRQLALLRRPAETARQLRAQSQDAGMRMRSLCLSAHRKFSLGSSDADTVRTGVELCERAFDFACEAGIGLLLIAGYDVYYEPSTERTRERFLAHLGSAARMAGERGLTLGLENVDSAIAQDVSGCLAILNQIDSPHLKLYLDIGNMNAQGVDYLAEIPKARGRVAALHIKDTRPGELRYVPLGAGSVRFAEVAGLLKSLGGELPCTAEMWHREGETCLESISSALVFLKRLFNGC